MKQFNSLTSTLLAAPLAILLSGAVLADDDDHAANLEMVTLSLQDAVQIALQESPGTVLEAELENEDGLVVWEVAVLDESQQLIEITIDANAGSVLEVEVDND